MLIKVNNCILKFNIQNCDQADKFSFYICKKICFSLIVMYAMPLGLHLYYYYKYKQLVRIECFDAFSFLASENNMNHKTKIGIHKEPFIDLIYKSLDYFNYDY